MIHLEDEGQTEETETTTANNKHHCNQPLITGMIQHHTALIVGMIHLSCDICQLKSQQMLH